MKNTLAILILVSLLLGACVTPERLNRLTEQNLGAKRPNYSAIYDDYVNVLYSNFPIQNTMAASKRTKNLFIPAILYWQWEKNIECTIDPLFTIDLFMKEAMKVAEEKDLKNRLEGQQLELTFSEIPNKYLYSHKGNAIILLFVYMVGDAEHLFPNQSGFKIQFRLLKDNNETKKGEIFLTHNMESMHNTRSSTGNFTNAFLDMYKMEIKKLGKDFTNKLIYKI